MRRDTYLEGRKEIYHNIITLHGNFMRENVIYIDLFGFVNRVGEKNVIKKHNRKSIASSLGDIRDIYEKSKKE